MKKEILITGIICLFIGVGIQPAFANENISNVRPSEDIEDCNCEVADNFNIARLGRLFNRIDSLIDRVEIFSKLMPNLYKDNPEVIKVSKELSEKIRPLKEMNEEFNSEIPSQNDYPDCDKLEELGGELFNFLDYLDFMAQKSLIMSIIIFPLYFTVNILFISTFILWLFMCYPF